MNPLVEFEHYLSRRSTEVCKILCVPYSTYADKRSQETPLPASIVGHIEALKRLTPGALNDLVRKRLKTG